MPNIASLDLQDARDYWSHEEHEFIPWIADQPDDGGASALERILYYMSLTTNPTMSPVLQ